MEGLVQIAAAAAAAPLERYYYYLVAVVAENYQDLEEEAERQSYHLPAAEEPQSYLQKAYAVLQSQFPHPVEEEDETCQVLQALVVDCCCNTRVSREGGKPGERELCERWIG